MAATAIAQKKVEKTKVFVWEGSDKKGKRVKGKTRAPNIALVRAELRKQGIAPLKVKKKAASLFSTKKRITPRDIAVFSRQLATMMDAGIPLVQSFDIVGCGHEKLAMRDLLLAIKADIEGGTTLAEALAKHPLYFDDLFCNLVRAGEAAGALETLLDKIASYKEMTESLKGKIKKALFYPVAVVIVAIVVTAIIMIFVIPQFQSIFSSFGGDLPVFTKAVVATSEWVQSYWWAVVLAVIGSIYAFSYVFKRSRKLRQATDRMLLGTPVIGTILHKASIARFSRTLATMFAAGVPLVEALEAVAGATGNIIYGDAVMRMREDVATGQSLHLAMAQHKNFPHMVIQMVAIGEESGSLDYMLGKAADFFEEEVSNAVDALSSLLEPLIMVVIGTLVGGLVIAMYLPIFKMASVV